MHEIGKSENNCFSAIPKLSTVTNSEPELKQHPAYGFKASLVCVLGNLCWKHRKNQDLVIHLIYLELTKVCDLLFDM